MLFRSHLEPSKCKIILAKGRQFNEEYYTDIDNMNREELLNELSAYRTLPGHGPDRGKMSDDELRNYLRFCRKAFDEYFEEE